MSRAKAGSSGKTETEDKFDVDADFLLPDFGAITGVDSVTDPVEHELEAIYFDTPELRLIIAGVTVRRRTGGSDQGWHLKLPVDARTRTEIRRPLGRAVRKVPKPLVDRVRVHVRDSELAPIVRIRTARTVRDLLDADGAVLAELADDRVVAEVLGRTAEIRSWREIEVELVDGKPGLLDAVGAALMAAGARPSAVRSKLARSLGDRLSTRASLQPVDAAAAGAVVLRYLRKHVAEFMRADPSVRTDQPDSVHRMRVAARRLRSVLKAYRPLFDTEVINPIRAELKWFGGMLSPARDAEVQDARLDRALAQLPVESVLGPVAARLDGEYRGRYQRAVAELRETMNGHRYFRLLDSLEDLVNKPPFTDTVGRPAEKVLLRRTHKAEMSCRSAVIAAEEPQLDSATRLDRRHAARKAAKRARYAAEAVRPVHKSTAKAMRKRMRTLQRALGEHRDAVLSAAELRTHAIAAHRAGENSFTYGLLAAAEERNAATALAAYRRAGKRFSVSVLRSERDVGAI